MSQDVPECPVSAERLNDMCWPRRDLGGRASTETGICKNEPKRSQRNGAKNHRPERQTRSQRESMRSRVTKRTHLGRAKDRRDGHTLRRERRLIEQKNRPLPQVALAGGELAVVLPGRRHNRLSRRLSRGQRQRLAGGVRAPLHAQPARGRHALEL